MCTNIREQNKNGSHFNKRNIRHLFVDANGTFNSGPIDLEAGQICMASGAFFRELDRETVENVEELNEMFKYVRNISESIGRYSVLRGFKELGMSLPTSNLATEDSDMLDESQGQQ